MAACGYSARDNNLIGQVKKVSKMTPVICSDYTEVNISLGVMRNGVGSMSHEDVWLYVQTDADVATLESAVKSGKLVEIVYDNKRTAICVPNMQIKRVTILSNDGTAESK